MEEKSPHGKTHGTAALVWEKLSGREERDTARGQGFT